MLRATYRAVDRDLGSVRGMCLVGRKSPGSPFRWGAAETNDASSGTRAHLHLSFRCWGFRSLCRPFFWRGDFCTKREGEWESCGQSLRHACALLAGLNHAWLVDVFVHRKSEHRGTHPTDHIHNRSWHPIPHKQAIPITAVQIPSLVVWYLLVSVLPDLSLIHI